MNGSKTQLNQMNILPDNIIQLTTEVTLSEPQAFISLHISKIRAVRKIVLEIEDETINCYDLVTSIPRKKSIFGYTPCEIYPISEADALIIYNLLPHEVFIVTPPYFYFEGNSL